MASFNEKHTWAIVFLTAAPELPFVKIPLIKGTEPYRLAMSGSLTQYERLVKHHGSIGTGQETEFCVFMLCHEAFFKDISSMAEIALPAPVWVAMSTPPAPRADAVASTPVTVIVSPAVVPTAISIC